MAWVLPADPAVGDFIKASWGQAVYDSLVFVATVIDTSTGKIVTNGVVEGSITALAVTEGKIGANAVAVGKLKMATVTGTFTNKTAISANIGTLVGNAYAHWMAGTTNSSPYVQITMGTNNNGGAQGVYIDGYSTSGVTVSYTIQYHSSSPPHRIAGELWGTFLYLLRRKSTGEILHHQWAPDPVWCRDETLAPFPKNDPRNAELLPHPWIGHDLTGLEVVLLDTRADALELVPYSETLARQERAKRTGLLRPDEKLDETEVHDFKAISRAEADHWFAMHTGRDPFERLRSIAEKASQQAKLGGKPLILGGKNFDQNVTIVTA